MEAGYHSTRPVPRDKAEHDLALNIKKATTPEETAPKQKHVRSCIVYTWDYHTSQSIWTGLKVQPILADEVQTFKALIAVHKIIRGGHPVTIKEAQNETSWLDSCAKSVHGDGFRGYGSLIRQYVSFLLSKLSYHKLHPEFNGNFDYEDYISLKGVDDPNEGYETINDLMNLQDQIDAFQKQVIAHFRASSNNETRMAALVPLVEESYGIYTFMTNMLRAMHIRTDAIDALEPLRSRFNAQHYKLRKFYAECANLQYLTRLINVPTLPQDPPSLIDGTAPALPKRPQPKQPQPPKSTTSSEPDALTEFWKNEDEAQKADQQRLAYEEQQRQLQAAHEAKMQAMRLMEVQRQRELEEQQRIQEERGRLAQEQLMREQIQRHAEGRVVELERELLGLKGQVDRDQMVLAQYDGRVKALENEMAQLNINAQQRLQSKDDMIKNLQDEILMWRKKYEALAKLYSQLRQEHLETLNKLKSFQLKANSAQEAIDKMERMERDMRAKNLELADMIRERDRVRHELDRLKASQRDELDRLRRDVTAAEARADELSRSKTSEIGSLMTKYNREKQELEDAVKAKQAYVEDLLKRLDDQKREIQSKDEELLITQASMDQALLELAQARDSTQTQTDSEQSLQLAVDTLILDHMKNLNEILDSMFQTCIQKIDDSLYELESPMQAGNQNSTPEYTLSMIEKATAQTSEFSFAFQKFLKDGRSKGHNEVIKTATMFAYAISDVLVNAKGITRFADEDETGEDIVRVGKQAAKLAQNFLESLKSYKLDTVHDSQQSQIVLRGDMDVQASLQKLSTIAESLVKHALNVSGKADGEIGDLVEKEMLNAAKVINDAVERLQALMSRPPDAGLSATELKVHDSILGCALAVTNAIAHLIKCATESQQEIVVKGRGTSSHAAFYKKHNRWTEGLISAAKAIAMATNLLIETADGVIHGTKSFEQLIVASNEVAAATAQLVAASRVKADFMSKTQDRLEAASKAVTDACKALVKAVKDIAARQLEDKDVGSDYYANLTPHDFKVAEMNQQVEILKLEKELVDARRRLAVMRKVGYHAEEDT